MIRHGSLLSRSVLLAGAAAVVVLVWGTVVQPLSKWKRNIIEQSETLRGDIHRLDASLAALTAERAALSGNPALDLVWQAEQAGQASAVIQGRLSELAKASGLSLRSITPLPARDLPLTQGVGFRLEFEAPLDRLIELLIAIEQSKPLLAIERATLRRLVRPAIADAATTVKPDQPELFVQIDIIAPVEIAQRDDGDDT